jgi:pilus assembly protein FimV
VLKLSKGAGIEKSSSEDAIGVQDKIHYMEANAIAGEKALNEAYERISLLESAMRDDAIAMEKALNETNERIALLEKNINELKHLLELQNPAMASAQKQAKGIMPDAGAELSSSVAVVEPSKLEEPSVAASVQGDESNNASTWQWLWWVAILLLLPIAGWRWKRWRASKNGTT